MYIREITKEEEDNFLLLAREHNRTFLCPEWLSIYPLRMGLYGIFSKKSNGLIGGFCVQKSKRFGIPLLNNCPFTPHVSLFYSNPAVNRSNFLSHRKKVAAAISNFLMTNQFEMASLSFPPEEQDMQPYIWNGLTVNVRYTYQINLLEDEKKIYSNFSPERRNDISKALKDGLTAGEITDYSKIKSLIERTFINNKLNYSPEILSNILVGFSTSKYSASFAASKSNKILACAFIVSDDITGYYLLGGYDKENRHHGAGALCLWEAIKAMKKKGVQVFDFEGSMIPPIESFFRGFGGTLVPYYQVRKYPFTTISKKIWAH